MRGLSSRFVGVRMTWGVLVLGCVALVPGCGRHVPVAEHPPPPAAEQGQRAEPVPPTVAEHPAPVAAQIVRPVPPSGATQPGQPGAGQVPHVMVFAGPIPGMTVTQAPPEPEPEPSVAYPSLTVACDSVASLVKRRLHVDVARRDAVPVDFGFGGPSRTGCELKASGKFERASPDSSGAPIQTTSEDGNLGNALQAAGWANLPNYQADGPDGEAEGWRSRETTCVVRWSWDGGDDSDSTYVASDDWDLEAGCTPWVPADSRRD